VFFEDGDYQAYVGWLNESAQRYECAVHAYVLMTNHVHLLVTPASRDSVTLMMQYIGIRYVPYINATYGTSGTLWEGRYKASLVQDEHYLLTCMRYIELNPVRAGMVRSPGHYRWSSYRSNAAGQAQSLITQHAEYRALGRTAAGRYAAYKALFNAHVDDPRELNEIRAAWQTGTPLGNDLFREKIERKLKCKVGHPRRGRPRSYTESDEET
jgi:putative transposase